MKNSDNSGRQNRNRARPELKWRTCFNAALLIPALLLASVAGDSQAAERSGQIAIGDVSGCYGDSVRITVSLQNNSFSIEQFGFDLIFCPEMLEYVSAERGDLIPEWPFLEGFELDQGCVRMGGFSPENPIPPQSSGILLYVNFTVTCDACLEGDVCEIDCINPVDDIVDFSIQNASFTYSCGEAVPCLNLIGVAVLLILLSGMKFKTRRKIEKRGMPIEHHL